MKEPGSKATLTRRRFLQAGGAALVGMTVAPRIVTAQSERSASVKKVRIGIVGGRFGATFQFHEHPDCVVQAVSDLRADRLETLVKTYGCTNTYPSLEELIKAKDIDAVGVFTGAPDHVRHAVACMRAGKHVISAVPACMTLDEAEDLLDTVKSTGLSYMMAETSYWHPAVITARQWMTEGRFGEIFYTEAEYHHPGLDVLYVEDGQRTWRYGLPPMNYPTHCTAYLVGVTRERLTKVSCTGWSDGTQYYKDNQYKNPFCNETAFFTTDKGHGFRVAVYWNVPARGTERGQWYGSKTSLFDPNPNGVGAVIIRSGKQTEKDDAGFVRDLPDFEQYALPEYWKTDMLPEPLRHESGHGGSHTFITHEFIDALAHDRTPAVNIYEALAMTVPGIVAHKSALQGGRQLRVPQFDPKA
ncbi:MAG: Gfo/Idh/MocA family oxidoreductase [Armatimonadetes bacterium]|nr:Gfo/Idh/MocA family oxidoreductase [Armatimonadota bacterium]